MINKNNKNFQITLDPESAELLESLAVRFKTSKSIVIRNALKVYASKKVHFIRMSFSTLLEVEQTEQKPSSKKVIENEEPKLDWDQIQKELQSTEPKEEGVDIIDYLSNK